MNRKYACKISSKFRWPMSKTILNPSVLEKLKNSIFKVPKFSQTLNISNQRITITKSINLGIIKNIIKDSFKSLVMKVLFTLILLEILLFQVFWYCDLSSGSQRAKGLSFQQKFVLKKMFASCWSYLKIDCGFEVLNHFYFLLILVNRKDKAIN